MSELTEDEIWLIKAYFAVYGFDRSHDILEIQREYGRFGDVNVKGLLSSLIVKKVLSLSPDQSKVKFTDYGFELFQSLAADQAEWERQPLIKVSSLLNENILIRSGERFKANRILREMFNSASSDLRIIDPYFGAELLDFLEDTLKKIQVRMITSSKVQAVAKKAYESFRSQYQSFELRSLSDDIHDRFVIVDGKRAFHVGHSIKDLGTKDCQINIDKNCSELVQLFEKRWAESSAI